MFASKITISEDTKKKNKMTVRQKGRVMFDRLKELEADGTLSKAKTRADVARLVGYSEERAKAGYAWVSNLIRRKHLSETIREWSPSGRMIAEYHTTNTAPDYGYEELKRRKEKKEQIADKWQKRETKHTEPVILSRAYVPESKTKMTIKTDVATIEIESVSVEIVEKVLGVCVNTKM